MKITTKYTSNAKGHSQIIAKGMGRQKTVGYNPAKSIDWNHGTAAGALLLKDSDDPILLAGEAWTHTLNDNQTHTFEV